MVNAMVWVHHMEAWVSLMMRHISIHVANLSTMERGAMLLVVGLLDQEGVKQGFLMVQHVMMLSMVHTMVDVGVNIMVKVMVHTMV